jgi:UDP-glucose 4-epimerase
MIDSLHLDHDRSSAAGDPVGSVAPTGGERQGDPATIAITGAGLIGCHAARRLVEAGNHVVLIDVAPDREYIRRVVGPERVEVVAADLRDLPALIHALGERRVATVVHSAGLIGKRVAENPYTGTTNNLLGTLHVLEAARLLGLARIVSISTFGVYDRSRIAVGPIGEDAPLGAHNLYTTTKLCAEHLVRAYAGLYRLDTIILRPAAVFGRGHYAGGSTVGLIMRDLVSAVVAGGAVALDAARYSANEYVYAKDVAQAIDRACRLPDGRSRAYNVGSGVVTSAADLARAVREVAPPVEVRIVGDEEEARRPLPLDLSRARDELGYRPEFSLRDALRDYLDAVRKEG